MADEPETVEFLGTIRDLLADGPRSRQMIVTLLADYWFAPDATAPAGALVDLAADFGITEAGARTVLVRLVRDQRIEAKKEGRRTVYALDDDFRRRLQRGLDRMRAFGEEETDTHRWTCVAFSVPEGKRAERHKLRRGLQWLGFAPLYDGLWISPLPVAGAAEALVGKLGIASASIFSADPLAAGSEYGSPTDAWDLESIRHIYDLFLAEAGPVVDAFRAQRYDDRQALEWRTQLVNVWRTVPSLDPGLPRDLLPEDWPRERARAVFEELYRGLAAPAERRVRTAVRRHAPQYVEQAGSHDFALRSVPS